MNLKINLLVIFAIFCIIVSAAVVCAEDHVDSISTQSNDYYLDESHDGHDGAIIPPDNTHDEARHAAGQDYYLDGSQDGHNGTIIPPDHAHDEAAMMNQTNATNATHAAGADVHNATNVTNATHAGSPHTMLATGNPILALLAVGSVLGGYAVIRRK